MSYRKCVLMRIFEKLKWIIKLIKFHQFHYLKQMNNKRKFFDSYKDIVLVTRLRIFCTPLFTNNNIKVVIQFNAFLTDRTVMFLFEFFMMLKKFQQSFKFSFSAKINLYQIWNKKNIIIKLYVQNLSKGMH